MAISCRRRAAGATRGVHYHRATGTLVSCTMTTSATSPARESRDSVVIRFAGDSGDGMQVTGGRFTVETALAGNDLTTFPDYPAEIRAPAGTTYGVSAFQIHFGAVDVMTPGDQVDVLVAMNPAALKVDLKDLRVGGTVVVDLGAFTERNLAKAGLRPTRWTTARSPPTRCSSSTSPSSRSTPSNRPGSRPAKRTAAATCGHSG